MSKPLLELRDVKKAYRMGPETVQVLHGVNLKIFPGEFVAIMGASGSGKSTLLHIAGALERSDSGEVLFDGKKLSEMYFWNRHKLRNRRVGFVFQFYHLLPELNVLENTLLPAMVAQPLRKGPLLSREIKQTARSLLDSFSLSHRLKHRPSQLSGGERQRVAIARALINSPDLLLADEPTGNLDAKTGRAILDVLINLHQTRKQTILLVTHDSQVASLAQRTIHLVDGRVK